ncbi:J domain-containing protein [Natronorubrum tibetense]|uniref:Chaperone protein DnaJ n=1 Tax=Natronorubrum tibetense GA33 TaxID=1114856 RepID=L9WBM7_9EURY|nr:DnaJ domain-containing protein [Natronorubrum tibetense]ELY45713.1 chaperone protein DnaJ [Natronorubrum tibetense GA33]
MTEDFYDLLEIPSDASQDEIKDAYREQVRVYHPDHNDDERARAQFTAVKKAYDILGDSVERQAYDRLGHEDYVAKRTSGLPSPDVWKSTDEKSSSPAETDAADEESGKTFTYSDDASASSDTGSSKSKTKATASSAGGATTSGSTAGTSSSASSTSASSGARATGTATGGATRTGAGTSSSGGTNRTAGSTDGGTSHATAGGRTGSRSRAESGRFGDNAAVRWWRRQNFSLPLIWTSVFIYLAGIGHFALANDSALEGLAAELSAVGTDPGGIQEVLASGRHGVDSTASYLAAFELVAPPLEQPLWEGVLAGVVALTLLGLLGVRAARDAETWGPISIDETIVLALAVAASTVLVGGPLLAGAVLMPVLFTVIVRHTRRGPGWKPSYLYVLPVLAPLVGVGISAAGEATLAIDLLAFVILPIVGGLGLPLRATVRKRFGW